ncbi:hypothetical protein SuUB85_05320 [Streptococcus uberis]|uniref:hypothetical protein n=1 Tax=Streptococcus uberis TaxID=1349 RepID=UPI003341C2B3
MQYQADTIEDYLEALPEERRHVMNQLRRVIKNNLPDDYEEKIQYNMISYVVQGKFFQMATIAIQMMTCHSLPLDHKKIILQSITTVFTSLRLLESGFYRNILNI